jgi:hypothetical protein
LRTFEIRKRPDPIKRQGLRSYFNQLSFEIKPEFGLIGQCAS